MRDYEIRFAFEQQGDKQLYIVATMFENQTKEQLYNSVLKCMHDYERNFFANIKYLQIRDLTLGIRINKWDDLLNYPDPAF